MYRTRRPSPGPMTASAGPARAGPFPIPRTWPRRLPMIFLGGSPSRAQGPLAPNTKFIMAINLLHGTELTVPTRSEPMERLADLFQVNEDRVGVGRFLSGFF